MTAPDPQTSPPHRGILRILALILSLLLLGRILWDETTHQLGATLGLHLSSGSWRSACLERLDPHDSIGQDALLSLLTSDDEEARQAMGILAKAGVVVTETVALELLERPARPAWQAAHLSFQARGPTRVSLALVERDLAAQGLRQAYAYDTLTKWAPDEAVIPLLRRRFPQEPAAHRRGQLATALLESEGWRAVELIATQPILSEDLARLYDAARRERAPVPLPEPLRERCAELLAAATREMSFDEYGALINLHRLLLCSETATVSGFAEEGLLNLRLLGDLLQDPDRSLPVNWGPNLDALTPLIDARGDAELRAALAIGQLRLGRLRPADEAAILAICRGSAVSDEDLNALLLLIAPLEQTPWPAILEALSPRMGVPSQRGSYDDGVVDRWRRRESAGDLR